MTGIPIAPLELVDTTCLAEFARAHWRKTTTRTVASSTATTDLLNGEFTIDAGAMGTTRTLRLVAKVLALNNNGSTIALPRWSLQIGAGTPQIDTGALAAAWATDANQTVWKIVAEITNRGVTNSQGMMLDVSGVGSFVAADAGLTTGNGHYGTGMNGSFFARALGFSSVATVDTTLAQALTLSVKLPTSSANVTCNLYDAYVEIV